MHENITALMSLELDGEATPAQQVALATHLSGCSACAETWEYWKAADRLLAGAPAVDPPRDLLAGLGPRLASYESQRRRDRNAAIVTMGAGLLLTLSFLLAIGLYVGWPTLLDVADLVQSGVRPIAAGAVWTLRGVATFARSASWQALVLGVGGYMVMAGLLVTLWVWILGRSRGWAVHDIAAR